MPPDCVVPPEEIELAKKNHNWWKDFLADFYRSFNPIFVIYFSHIKPQGIL